MLALVALIFLSYGVGYPLRKPLYFAPGNPCNDRPNSFECKAWTEAVGFSIVLLFIFAIPTAVLLLMLTWEVLKSIGRCTKNLEIDMINEEVYYSVSSTDEE